MELIISRRLTSGQHLFEQDLARQLGVSRHPIREALQALHAEGWVDLRPGYGAFVHEPSPTEVDEVFSVRVMLEGESAALAAHNDLGPNELRTLRSICQEGRDAVRVRDVDRVVERNAALHHGIWAAARNSILEGFLNALDKRIRWYFTRVAIARGTASWDEHSEILDALAARDADRARGLMRTHAHRSWEAYTESRP